jgi:hypothetical protein
LKHYRYQRRPSERIERGNRGGTPEKGIKIVLSSTPPNSTQEESPDTLLQHLALFREQRRLPAHIVTVPPFSQISSSNE